MPLLCSYSYSAIGPQNKSFKLDFSILNMFLKRFNVHHWLSQYCLKGFCNHLYGYQYLFCESLSSCMGFMQTQDIKHLYLYQRNILKESHLGGGLNPSEIY